MQDRMMKMSISFKDLAYDHGSYSHKMPINVTECHCFCDISRISLRCSITRAFRNDVFVVTSSPSPHPEPLCVGPVGPGKLEWDDLIEAFDKYEQSNEISEDVKCQMAKVPIENTMVMIFP